MRGGERGGEERRMKKLGEKTVIKQTSKCRGEMRRDGREING